MKSPDFFNVDNSLKFQNWQDKQNWKRKSHTGAPNCGLCFKAFISASTSNKDCHGFTRCVVYYFKPSISLDSILVSDEQQDFINYVVTIPSNYWNNLIYSCPDVFINQFPTLESFALHVYSLGALSSSVFFVIWNYNVF